MPCFQEKRLLPYAAADLFAMVADIAAYPEFLPGCLGARVYAETEEGCLADLVIGFKALRERYTSRVQFDRAAGQINVIMERGPFTHLETHWHFVPRATENGLPCTEVHFSIDFAFRSAVLERLMGTVFEQSTRKMMSAFEKRAQQLSNAST